MPYKLVQLELSEPLPTIALNADQDGVGLVARWRDRLVGFHMFPARIGEVLDAEALAGIVDVQFAAAILTTRAEDALTGGLAPSPVIEPPSLTIAICTKDRAKRLERLLTNLTEVICRSPFASVEILVVDNAPSDESTCQAVSAFGSVRYLREPKAGLDFARNAALAGATGDFLTFLDDDVVVDRGWLVGLFEAWRACPEAGGYTGLVLPFRLDTAAQIHFESHGGFGRGFTRRYFGAEKLENPLHPVGAGVLGAGCNMTFDRRLLLQLGGFDEALDTGAPLPGGGDLDIFYRVLRAGRTMVYEPSYAVYHEHRDTLAQLQRQYWSWGLGFMAFLRKCRLTDPAARAKQKGILRWWFFDKAGAIWAAATRLEGRALRFQLAELWGGLQGLFGEYERSQARSAGIRGRAT